MLTFFGVENIILYAGDKGRTSRDVGLINVPREERYFLLKKSAEILKLSCRRYDE